MLIKQRNDQLANSRGFTFTELLVALTISALLFSLLIGVFIANLNHYHKSVNTNRLNQQLQSTLDLMTNDIRRAGYWANANGDVGTNQNNNPFMASATDITVNASKNCILFTYDHGNTGTLPSISSSYDDDRYGYRLSNGAVQTRPPGASFSCTAASSAWENVTDTNIINITDLTFTLNSSTVTTGPGVQGLTMRSVDISITGQLVSDSTIARTLTQHVRIRNDKFIP